jgi:hypothetical protein
MRHLAPSHAVPASNRARAVRVPCVPCACRAQPEVDLKKIADALMASVLGIESKEEKGSDKPASAKRKRSGEKETTIVEVDSIIGMRARKSALSHTPALRHTQRGERLSATRRRSATRSEESVSPCACSRCDHTRKGPLGR